MNAYSGNYNYCLNLAGRSVFLDTAGLPLSSRHMSTCGVLVLCVEAVYVDCVVFIHSDAIFNYGIAVNLQFIGYTFVISSDCEGSS